ncbi:tetratricopeptide repeat protein [Dokdonella sp.]|uniref:tetratricopeptide repeat protein n=1 Tax=Dokdonella sp. TaxID=2291710 RepID=UPI003783D555
MNSGHARYRAFISYSHRDGKLAQKLHRRLETFSVPRALRGARPDGTRIDARIGAIFRDRDELASAGSLSRSIEQALDDSAALIVICSPAAVASRWVGEEIAYYRRRHPERPVFAFVGDGDPGLDPRTDPMRAAFPANLALADVDDATGPLGEPIAADARAQGDGFSQAFLKLVAGLLGLRYDQLRQREQRRRQRRWTVVAALASLLAAVFAVLAVQAMRARNVAREAQARAELELTSEQQTREFLLSVFRLSDASEARGNNVTVREVLDRAVARIDSTAFARKAVRARFLATMGQAYASLGLTHRGTALLRQSIEDAPASDPELLAQRIDSGLELADLLYSMGEYDEALAALQKADAGERMSWQQRARLGNVRGDVLAYSEKDADARIAYQAALDSVPTGAIASRDGVLARSRSLAGFALLAQFGGDYDSAMSGYASVVALLESAVGEKQPDTINAILALGSNAYLKGDLARARIEFERCLRAAQSVYDAGSPVIASIESNLGRLLLETGDAAGAEPMLRDALASDRKYMSENFDDLAYPLFNLAAARYAQGDRDEAKRLLEEAAPIADRSHHRMHGPILSTLADLACSGSDTARGAELAASAVTVSAEHADIAPWYAAQAKLTQAYCQAMAGTAVAKGAAAALAEQLEHKWGAASPFTRRARAQVRAIEGAGRR